MAGVYPRGPIKPKLLIVDDVELNRAILSELFCGEYDVLEAENGKKAIEILEVYADSLAVILLDIVMPVMDGFGVLREMVRRHWSGRIPVVMITAETSDSVMQKGYEMGAADIISKPFNPNIIRQRISNIIEQYTYKLHLEKLVAEQTETLRRQSQKLRENSAQMIDTLSAIIEFKNTESVQHIANIRTITRMLLNQLKKRHQEYGLTDEMVENISEAAAMHDIGKIAIPDQILNKPGKLTPEEFEVMKTHTVRGCEILEKLVSVQSLTYYDYCYEICRHHHERWDGRGYPDGLVEDETPIWAQAVSLADVYDALSSKRVYKEAYSSDVAVQMILNGECGVFNPVLLECFLEIVSTFKDGIDQAQIEREQQKNRPSEAKEENVQEAPDLKMQEGDLSYRTLRLLELERQKYRVMSELSGEILFEYEIKTDKLVFSEKYQTLTGNDLIIKNLRQAITDPEKMQPNDLERLREKISGITYSSPDCKLEMEINLDGNGFEWFEVYLYPIWDAGYDAECVGYIGKLINIEEQKRMNLKLQKEADSDPLTGVLNRKAIQEQISQILSEGKTEHAALCFIDIDNFKSVNDDFGHLFGDSVLKHVVSVLLSNSRNTDLVGRIGGDEFVIFLRDISSDEALGKKLQSICDNLSRDCDGCQLSCSLGVSRYPHDGDNYGTLLHKADQALYLSKRLGKNGYQIYHDDCGRFPFQTMLSGVDEYVE